MCSSSYFVLVRLHGVHVKGLVATMSSVEQHSDGSRTVSAAPPPAISPVPPTLQASVAGGERDVSVDYLRFIGMILVVSALPASSGEGSGSPYSITRWQFILSFSSIVMILPSALSLKLVAGRSFLSNLRSRLQFLLFSSFAAGAIVFVASTVLDFPLLPSCWDFFFLSGHIWFVRGYLLIALSQPIIKKFSRRTKRHSFYFVAVMLTFLLHHVFCVVALRSFAPVYSRRHYENFAPFPFVAAIFYRLPELKTKGFRLLCGAFFTLLLVELCVEFGLVNVPLTPAGPSSLTPNLGSTTRLPAFSEANYAVPTSVSALLSGIVVGLCLYRGIPLWMRCITRLGLHDAAVVISQHSYWFYLLQVLVSPALATHVPTFSLFLVTVLVRMCGGYGLLLLFVRAVRYVSGMLRRQRA